MKSWLWIALSLTACGGPAADPPATAGTHAFDVAPPPGSGDIVLTAPSSVIAGETVTWSVTGAALALGDRVDFGFGTAEGPGFCPFRVETGGSPCIDVTGRVRQIGTAYAADDAGTMRATFQAPFVDRNPVVYVQAFLLRGGASATSNVVAVTVQQAWPALDPRIDALETAILEGQATVAAMDLALTTRLNGHDTALGTAQANTTALANAVAAADNALQSLLTALDGELGTLDGRVTTVQNALQQADTDLQSAITALDGEVGQLELDLEAADLALGSTITGHGGRLTNLEAALPPAGSAIAGIVTASRTLNVPSQYASIAAALDSLDNVRIAPDAIVTIQVADGVYTLASPIRVNHPDGRRIYIRGNASNANAVELRFNNTNGFEVAYGGVIGYIDGFHISEPSAGSGNWGVSASYESTIHMGSPMRITGFEGGAILANQSSTVVCGGAGTTLENNYYGVQASLQSYVSLGGATVRNNTAHGIAAFYGSVIDASYATATTNTLTSFLAEFNSYIHAPYATSTDPGYHGFVAQYASGIGAPYVTSTAGIYGILAQFTSYVYAYDATANSNTSTGVSAQFASSVYAQSVTANNNAYHGIYATHFGNIYAPNSQANSNGNYGVISGNTSNVLQDGTTYSGNALAPAYPAVTAGAGGSGFNY